MWSVDIDILFEVALKQVLRHSAVMELTFRSSLKLYGCGIPSIDGFISKMVKFTSFRGAFPLRPVLKHGPRSLSYMRVQR